MIKRLDQCSQVSLTHVDEVTVWDVGIYDLSGEVSISRRERKEAEALNEGAAGIDDFKNLEIQARNYFNEVKEHPVKEKEVDSLVKGFIQFSDGIRFDQHGDANERWRSFGHSINLDVKQLYAPEFVIQQVEELGVEWSPLVRVVFYGPALERIVGTKVYERKAKKELVPLDGQYERILLAVPSHETCHVDSTFSMVEKLVADSIGTGKELGLDRVTLAHWELTHTRLQELECEEAELQKERDFSKRHLVYLKKERQFQENFKDAKGIIDGLNHRKIKVSDLEGVDLVTLRRVIYLCTKGEERIEKPSTYFQVRSLVKKKSAFDYKKHGGDAINYVNQINRGELVDVNQMSFDQLEGVMNLLWSNSGTRIDGKYKQTYFSLKERYLQLKSQSKKTAA